MRKSQGIHLGVSFGLTPGQQLKYIPYAVAAESVQRFLQGVCAIQNARSPKVSRPPEL